METIAKIIRIILVIVIALTVSMGMLALIIWGLSFVFHYEFKWIYVLVIWALLFLLNIGRHSSNH